MGFTNLHLHTTYSWDSVSDINKIVDFVKSDGQIACAITDHGNMSGAIEFYNACKKAGIKPVIGCLLKGQEIFAKNGAINIENIKIGDEVYTHTGKLQKVIGTMQRKFKGDLFTIQLANSNSRSLKVTGEHPILISNINGDKKWVKVSEINTDKKYKNGGMKSYTSFVCCPKIKGNLTHLNVSDFLPNNFTIADNKIIKTFKYTKFDSLKIEWTNFKEKIELTKKFCYFWGLFLSEGSFGHNKNSNRLNGQCYMTFNIKETKLADFCKSFLKEEFYIDAKIYPHYHNNSLDLVWCNIPFANIFAKLVGVGASNKFIHSEAFNMPLNLQEFLLEGILDGDCKHLGDTNKSKSQTLRVASKNFAWGFRQLLINRGYFARVCKDRNGKFKYYNVPYQKYSKYKRSWDDENYVYYPIKNVLVEQIETTVYNFHVENDNSYLSDYALHNCEMYICASQKSATDKSSSNRDLNHLVLLAKNFKGYQNLLKLTSLSNEHYYYRPRIDEEMLFKYSEGIIAINGHIGTSIFDTLFFNLDGVSKCDTISCAREYLYADYEQRFLEVASRYYKTFGNDFYVECQLFDPEDIVQQASGHILFELAKKHGFKVVGTGDAHYIDSSECDVHKTFVAIKQNTKVNLLPNMRYLHSGMYGIVTNEHAKKCYPPDLIKATEEIVSKIEDYSILRKERIPKFSAQAFEDLSSICFSKLKEMELDTPEYIERLNYELGITKAGKLEDYFMIVADYINYAIQDGMLIGPGRGCLGHGLVEIKNGTFKDISLIKIGDLVKSNDGFYHKVLETFKYPCDENLLKINTMYSDTQGISVTKDHKILSIKRKKNIYETYVSEESEPSWKKAEDLSVGDLIARPKNRYKISSKKYINLKKYIDKSGIINGKTITTIKNGNQFCRAKTLTVPSKIKLDKQFFYMLGLFIGDGWLSKNKNNISFCFNSETGKKQQQFIINYFTKLGCSYRIIKNQNGKKVNQIHFTNLIIYNLFKTIFKKYKHKAYSKYIPLIGLSASLENTGALIKGLVDSDGHTEKNGSTRVTTVSKKLAYQIKFILEKIGIYSSVIYSDRKSDRVGFTNTLPSYNIKFNKKNTYIKYDDAYVYAPILKIEEIKSNKFVYDIKVEHSECYNTSCGIVHNSSGGSLIAYLTKITGLDPIKYKLIFERFYSPDRAAFGDIPDVDTDFPTSGRDKVIDYLRQKYGADRVAGVVTFSTLQGKGAIKDVLRAWNVCSFQEMNKISDLIPSRDKISDKLEDFKNSHGTESIIMYTLVTEPTALSDYVVLDDEGNLHGEYAPYFKIAIQMEGAIKSESKHASAVIISDCPITEWAPLLRDKNSDNLICAYDMDSFPKAGGVKFDILALKSLDGLMEVNSLIREIGIDG